jgi:RHH-type transcriptional regulator, rel operon repressor / antitoxin RelB
MRGTEMPKPALSLDLPDEIDQRLARVSTLTNQPKTELVREAVVEYLDQIEWRSREIEAALAEADAGVFISHEVMLKWASNLTDETRSCESDNTSG